MRQFAVLAVCQPRTRWVAKHGVRVAALTMGCRSGGPTDAGLACHEPKASSKASARFWFQGPE